MREICTLSDRGNLSFGNSANVEKGGPKKQYLLRGRISEKVHMIIITVVPPQKGMKMDMKN